MTQLTVEDWDTGEPVTFELDATKSGAEQVMRRSVCVKRVAYLTLSQSVPNFVTGPLLLDGDYYL